MRRVGAAADLIDGKIGSAELLERGDDHWICFIARLAAGADVERKSDGVIADVGRVVTGGAGPGDGSWTTDGCVVVESANARDDDGLCVENLFAGGDLAPHLIAGLPGSERHPGEVRGRGDVLPGSVEREGVFVEVDADGCAAERVVDAGSGVKGGESAWATGSAIGRE